MQFRGPVDLESMTGFLLHETDHKMLEVIGTEKTPDAQQQQDECQQ